MYNVLARAKVLKNIDSGLGLFNLYEFYETTGIEIRVVIQADGRARAGFLKHQKRDKIYMTTFEGMDEGNNVHVAICNELRQRNRWAFCRENDDCCAAGSEIGAPNAIRRRRWLWWFTINKHYTVIVVVDKRIGICFEIREKSWWPKIFDDCYSRHGRRSTINFYRNENGRAWSMDPGGKINRKIRHSLGFPCQVSTGVIKKKNGVYSDMTSLVRPAYHLLLRVYFREVDKKTSNRMFS